MRPVVREFYAKVEHILLNSKFSDLGKSHELKSLIYRCLDDIIVSTDDVELDSSIVGRGANSEVYLGTYLYCPVAVKKIRMEGYSEKQLVWLDLQSSVSSTRYGT